MTQCSQRSREVKSRANGTTASWPERTGFSYGKSPAPVLVFDAESVTQDAGLVAVRELDHRLGLTEAAASFVDDFRDPDMTVHPLARLIREAAYARAAGYEDANDCTTLAGDAYFTELVGPTNETSVNPKRHDGLAHGPRREHRVRRHVLGPAHYRQEEVVAWRRSRMSDRSEPRRKACGIGIDIIS